MTAKITLNANSAIAAIDERIYGSFIEHMGRAVYTGIYEPTHPTADANGFRQDVTDLIRPLKIPVIRYPGGNFVSGYRWEDGVGSSRPVRPDLAWQAIEPNQVGTNEFMDFLSQVGARPMFAVNLGTRGAQEAADLLEYCNFPSGTYLSDLRIAHGYPQPHNIKLWCLGNEMDGPWQICAKTAEEYGRLAHETAKMMRLLDPEIELVVCGSSFREMPTFGDWERTVLRHTYDDVDYLSLHTYYQNLTGDIPSFLASNVRMDSFIKEVRAICEEIKAEKGSEKDIYLSFDEWNVWYHFQKDGKQPPKWTVARPIEEEAYDFADALLVGSMLITLINNADFVKIACLAQLVNTLAPIMTEPNGKAWAQTTYYPFLYTSQRGRGRALKAELNAPTYNCKTGAEIPYIDCAAVLSNDELTLFMVNKNLDETLPCELSGLPCKTLIEWITLNGHPLYATNTANSAPVQPRTHNAPVTLGETISFTLPKASWNMIRFAMPIPG
ncbi:MAG: alpha-N-arabinofuranosidase [Clostridiales bacterium]|nr:alpha-N-arabinofuranosidase [Clostridiales bacterium]